MSPARQRQVVLPRILGPFASRPHLLGAILVGVVVGAACLLLPGGPSPVTSIVYGWDALCLTFIMASLAMMRGAQPSKIRATAARQDEGQGFILSFVTLAAAASIGGTIAELSAGGAGHGLATALRVFATVAASWFMVQMIFALHYAHEYYAPDGDPSTDVVAGGLLFPGDEQPDYWDFLHFSLVIGVASQTADIAFTSKALRRIGSFHGVVAFTFNTVVLALAVSQLGGLL